MATKGQSIAITYTAYDLGDGGVKTGDVSNHTVRISADGGSFASATNTPSELGYGVYVITLTASETNCNSLTLQVSSSTTGVIIPPVQITFSASGTAPTAVENAAAVWGYSSGRTVTNTIPSASDNATAIWGAASRTLTASPTDISGLATSSALSTVASNVTAIKAKTDNLPASPAAVGSAMTLTSAYDAAKTAAQAGDAMTLTSTYDAAKTASQFNASTDTVTINSVQAATMVTATGFATPSNLTGLSTFNPATDRVLIDATQAAGMATATGFSTPSDINTAQSAIINAMPDVSGLSTFDPDNDTVTIDATQAAGMATATGFATPADLAGLSTFDPTNDTVLIDATQAATMATADVSGLATSSALSAVATNVTAIKGKTDNLPSSPASSDDVLGIPGFTWLYPTRKLTSANLDDISFGVNKLALKSDIPSVASIQSGLSTFDPANDTVLIDSTQAATMTTATGFATASDISSAVADLETYGENHWTGGGSGGGATAAEIWNYSGTGGRTLTASPTDVSGLATKTDLSNVQTAITGAMPSTSGLATSTDISDAQTAIINALPTIPSDYAKAGDTMALSTTDINSIKSGLATSTNVSDAQAAVIAAIPSVPSDYAKPGDAMTLTSAYDAAKTASQLTAADIPTSDIAAIKAKTDNLPASPAATGTEMSLTNATITAIQNGVATSANISALQTHGDSHWGISPEGEITVVVDADEIAEAVWNNDERTLTDDISTITAQDVWEYGSRTLTQYGPDISPDEPVGAVYCTPSDVERRWGINNVRQWADLENDGDNAKIQTQIDWAILAASERINSDLAASIYLLPFNPVPYAVRRFAATLAGVELYNTRAVNISRDQSNAEIRTALADYSNWITSVLSNVPIVGATLK